MKEDNNSVILYKQKILRIAKAFDKFCNKHNLQYFAIGGTCIGIIRHKGMIPWDDDIDVAMPRDDYERFLKLAETELDSDFCLINARNTLKYYNSITKMCDAHTTLWEGPACQCVIGAFIDIFPMDGLPNTNPEDRIAYFNNYLRLRNSAEGVALKANIRSLLSAIKHRNKLMISRVYWNWKYRLLRKQNNRFKMCDDYLKNYSYEDSEYVAYLGTFRGPRIITRKACFESYIYMPFEDFQLRVPIGYDEYLQNTFGDYMRLPPKEEQVSNHSHYFEDLNKRLTMKQVKIAIRQKASNT